MMSPQPVAVLAPAAAVIGRWLPDLAAWRWLLVPLALAVVSRAVVVLVGYVGLRLVPANPDLSSMFQSAAYSARPYLGRWYGWDASWYSTIALKGYQASGPEEPTLAFWPLLPLLKCVVGQVLAALSPRLSPAEAVAWAGLLVVFVAFACGLVLFYRLVLEDHGPDVARRAVAFLAFAPGAFFYTAAYPEALLLAGVVGCLWALRHERWLLAGLAGCVAASAQVPGSLLVFPFAWEYWRRRGQLGGSLLWGLLIPLGPATWLVYLGATTGDLLAPVTRASKFWAHYYAWPWDTITRGFGRVLGGPAIELLDLLNLCITIAALGACLWALRAGYPSWGIWGLAVLALYLAVPSARPFDGMLRYCLPVLPLWLLAARAVRSPALEGGLIGGFAAILGLLTALYVNGYWIA